MNKPVKLIITENGYNYLIKDAPDDRNKHFPANFMGNEGMVCCACWPSGRPRPSKDEVTIKRHEGVKIEKHGYTWLLKEAAVDRVNQFVPRAFGLSGMMITKVMKTPRKY